MFRSLKIKQLQKNLNNFFFIRKLNKQFRTCAFYLVIKERLPSGAFFLNTEDKPNPLKFPRPCLSDHKRFDISKNKRDSTKFRKNN